MHFEEFLDLIDVDNFPQMNVPWTHSRSNSFCTVMVSHRSRSVKNKPFCRWRKIADFSSVKTSLSWNEEKAIDLICQYPNNILALVRD